MTKPRKIEIQAPIYWYPDNPDLSKSSKFHHQECDRAKPGDSKPSDSREIRGVGLGVGDGLGSDRRRIVFAQRDDESEKDDLEQNHDAGEGGAR